MFDEDCYCLDVVGVNSEFLFLLTAKLLEAFGATGSGCERGGPGGHMGC